MDARHLLTCAHVVAAAAGGDESAAQAPGGPVFVDFPENELEAPAEARVLPDHWLPVAGDETGDIAVLRLKRDAPEGCMPPPFLAPPRLEGHGFGAYGFPDGHIGPAYAHGTFRVRRGPRLQWVQLEHPGDRGPRVRRGFSGGPVWDDTVGAVVGIVVAEDGREEATAAMIPVPLLAAAYPGLARLTGWRLRFDPEREPYWYPRALGVESVDDVSEIGARTYFTGRVNALRELVGWMEGDDDSARVVLGGPGSGKSAVLARIVTTADPEELAHVPAGEIAEGTLPRPGAVGLAIRATGKRTADIRDEIARWFDLDPAKDLRAELRRATGGRLPTIVIDALDEADDPRDVVRGIVWPLGPDQAAGQPGAAARLLIGLRREFIETLQGLLEPVSATIDLDDETRYLDRGDIQTYAKEVLRCEGLPQFARQPDRTRELAHAIARTADRSFLLALLLSRWVGLREPEAAAPETFPDSVDRAMEMYIARVADRRVARGEPREQVERELKELLGALAYAQGPGLPEAGPVWPVVAGALAGHVYAPEHLTALDVNARTLIQARSAGGRRHARLFHAALADHLRLPGDDAAVHRRIAGALVDLARADGGELDDYVARYLPAHVAAAEPPAWELLRDPAVVDRVDATALAAAAMRFPVDALPDEVVGVVRSQNLVVEAGPPDRRGLRQLGMARSTGARRFEREPADPETAAWTIRSAVLSRQPLHYERVAGAVVTGLVCVDGPEGVPLLVAACEDGRIRRWSTRTGEPFGAAFGGEAALVSLAVAGESVVTADVDGIVSAWDPVSGRRLRRFRAGEAGSLHAVASWSAETRSLLVTVGKDGSVRSWDADSGDEAGELGAHSGPALAVAGAGGRVVTGGYDGYVRTWPPAGDGAGEPLRGHTDWVAAVAVGGEGDAAVAVSGGYDGRAIVWESLQPPGAELPHPCAVRAVATFAAGGGMRVVTADAEGVVRLWDPRTQTELGPPLVGHAGCVRALVTYRIGPGDTGIRIASAGEDATVRIWSPASVLREEPGAAGGERVRAVAVTAAGRVATGGDHGVVRIWDPDGGSLEAEASAHTGAVRALEVHGDAIWSGGDDEVLRTWDVPGDRPAGDPLVGHTAPIRAFAACGDDRVVSGGEDGTVRIWERGDERWIERTCTGGPGRVRALAHLPTREAELVAVAGRGRDVELLELPGLAPVARLGGHRDWVMAAWAFTHEGRTWLAAAGDDGAVCLWDRPGPGRAPHVLLGHTGPVRAVTALEGGRLASGGADRTLRIWDLARLRETRCVPLGCCVNALAPIEGGLVIGTDDGHLIVDLP